MAEGKESTFNLVIGAVDKFTAPFAAFNNSVSKSIAPINKLGSSINALGQELGAGKIVAGLRGVGAAGKNAFSEIGALAGKAALIGGAVGAGIFGLAKMTSSAADEADESAQKAGITAQAWQEMAYAAQFSGIEASSLTSALGKLNKNAVAAASGNKQMSKWFRQAGVRVKDASGKVKSADVLFGELSKTFEDLPDGAQKTALAMGLFGKSGAELLPMLNSGSKELAELRAEAQRFGLVLDKETIAAGVEWEDNLTKMSAAFRGAGYSIGGQLVPPLNKMTETITNLVAENKDLIAANLGGWIEGLTNYLPKTREEFQGLFTSVENFGKSVIGGIDAIGGMGNALMIAGVIMAGPAISSVLSLAGAIGKLGIAIATTPVGMFAAALAVLGFGVAGAYANFGSKAENEALDKARLGGQMQVNLGGSSASGGLGYTGSRSDDEIQRNDEAILLHRQRQAKITALGEGFRASQIAMRNASPALAAAKRQAYLASDAQNYDYLDTNFAAPVPPIQLQRQNTTHTEVKQERVEVVLRPSPEFQAQINGPRLENATVTATPGPVGLNNP